MASKRLALTCVKTFGHRRGIDQVAFANLAADVLIQGLEFDLPLHRVNHGDGGDGGQGHMDR